MSKYIIEATDRYEVEASSLEVALASYRVRFDDVPPALVSLTPEQVLDSDAFEYLDGSVRAEEANE